MIYSEIKRPIQGKIELAGVVIETALRPGEIIPPKVRDSCAFLATNAKSEGAAGAASPGSLLPPRNLAIQVLSTGNGKIVDEECAGGNSVSACFHNESDHIVVIRLVRLV